MKSEIKNFHFQEVDWVICFAESGNSGKYRDYNVFLLKSAKEDLEESERMSLGEILDMPEIENHYPHTVGYFKTETGQKPSLNHQYLELRGINTLEEFWSFLNAANL
jgi:hypothetical protein